MELKPPTPRLEMLCHVAVKVATPQLIGTMLTGERRIIPIIGGRFEGPKMRGEILPGGADWQIVAADGTTSLEARYTLKTDDGALIYVRNVGLRHGPPEVLAAIKRGEFERAFDFPHDCAFRRLRLRANGEGNRTFVSRKAPHILRKSNNSVSCTA